MRRAFRIRLRLLSGAILLFALLLITRLYFVQIVHGADFALAAERQYTSASETLYDRGSIYFTRKDGALISAAALESGFTIAVHPKKLTNPAAAYEVISPYASTTLEELSELAALTDDPYEVVARRVTEEAGKAIAEAKVPGVIVERERWRSYPGGARAARSIGFVAYDDNNVIAGRAGLERYYDDVLTRSASGMFDNFFSELFANLDSVVADAGETTSGNLITTIEPVVEEQLERILRETNARYESAETSGIIMNPKTGEIIALGTYPTFDPNRFAKEDPDTFGNPLVEHRHEFGSIMKALTMVAGIDSGAVTANTTYADTGCTTLNTKKFCNHDLKARGETPMQEVLSQSLNLGAAFVASRIGHERMREYFTQLGFGTETGIDLPSEIHGDIENLKSPRDVEFATASFGQGIAVTPVAMLRALGSLANEGQVVTPHVVNAIRLESGITKKLNWGEPERVFSAAATEEVTRMLVAVVDDALAGGNAGIAEMSIAAKTGTAQVAAPGGGYYDNRYFHSFFGYFPAYDPQFIVLLYTRHPQGVRYASETLTEPFMELARFLISYYAIPPDRALSARTTP